MSNMHRAFALTFACCFLIGGTNHGLDIWRDGLFPYHAVPRSVNAFWTALCPLDLALAALIWWQGRPAIVLGIAVMLADVGVNSWLAYFSGLHFQSFEPLQVQSLFLGFLLGGAPFALRRQ